MFKILKFVVVSPDGAENAERAGINVERIRQVSWLHASHRTGQATAAAAVSLQHDRSSIQPRQHR